MIGRLISEEGKRVVRFLLVFTFILVSTPVSQAAAPSAEHDISYTGPWRNTSDIVDGWDWTLPPHVVAASRSGIFNYNSRVPPGFRGNHLKQVNADWRDLEPERGRYEFSQLVREIKDPAYDGVMLNVRGVTWSKNGSPNVRTAPDWLSDAPKITESHVNGFQLVNLDITNENVKHGLIGLWSALGKAGIPQMPEVKFVIVHGPSHTEGEEWSGSQVTPAGTSAMLEILAAHIRAVGPADTWKLAWPKHYGPLLEATLRAGGGQRNSNIEKWLVYFPNTDIGETFTDAGYIEIDESLPLIAEKRHFQDQNERYGGRPTDVARFGNPIYWPLRYRHANLRALQARRNVLWLERDSVINPPMVNWVGLELGRNVTDAPDAWVALMRTWVRHGGGNREVNNFERWLYQRDINGVKTTPTVSVDHGFNASANGLLPENLWYSDTAKQAPLIGFAMDDRFLSREPHSVAIKVTFHDVNSSTWSLVYQTPSGERERSIKNGNTNKVRTATFFADDFVADADGKNFDFSLRSNGEATPFSFVRLIKVHPSSTSPVPRPPTKLTVGP